MLKLSVSGDALYSFSAYMGRINRIHRLLDIRDRGVNNPDLDMVINEELKILQKNIVHNRGRDRFVVKFLWATLFMVAIPTIAVATGFAMQNQWSILAYAIAAVAVFIDICIILIFNMLTEGE